MLLVYFRFSNCAKFLKILNSKPQRTNESDITYISTTVNVPLNDLSSCGTYVCRHAGS